MRQVVLVALFVLLSGAALAHRVNIFAYVEGGDVVVECSFSRSNPVRQGTVEVYDQGGEMLLQGQTDQAGHFRFPVPEQALGSKSGLTIRLLAGEGHQNEWTVDWSELAGAALSPAATRAKDAPTPAVSAQTDVTPSQTLAAALTRTELEEIVNAALDAKLAPIKRAVLEKSGPGLTEIVGGIGWILGLVGLAAYFKSRPRV